MSASAELAKSTFNRRPPEKTGGEDIDVSKLVLDSVNHNKLDIDVASSITAASLELTMEGASTVSVTISDPRRVLLQSTLFDFAVDIDLDGQFFRLAQVTKAGDELTLTFEDRIIAYLRRYDDHKSISRNKMTRAEFIRHLTRRVHKNKVRFYSPELHKRQPIAKTKDERDRQDNREPGLEGSKNVKAPQPNPQPDQAGGGPHDTQFASRQGATNIGGPGGKLDSAQLFVAEQILDAGYSMGMNNRILQSALMVAGVETQFGKVNNNPFYVGVFQQNPTSGAWPATNKVVPDAKGYFRACKKIYDANPGLSLVLLGWKTQAPGDPAYQKKLKSWQPAAKKLLEEYGLLGGSTDRTFRKKYSFTVGPPDGPTGEDYWQAMTRLAAEVEWRLFVSNNTLYYVADRDLVHSKPRMVCDEDTEGVDAIDFDWDVGKRNNEATIACRAKRWFAPPGSVVKLINMGPANGRWLVNRIERDLFSTDTTITLKRAMDPKKEPATTLVSTSYENVHTKDGARGIVEQAVDIAIKISSDLFVVSDYRKNSVTSSGNPSDHSENNANRAARDIAKHGVDAINGPPSKELDEASVAIGKAFGRHYKAGQVIDADTFQWGHYQVQIIWRTPKYGGHMGHVHVGAHLNRPGASSPNAPQPPSSGKPGPRYGGGAGATP